MTIRTSISKRDRNRTLTCGAVDLTTSLRPELQRPYSAELEPDALLALRSLGQALQSQELKNDRIQIMGHTDAKGSEAYNQKLSERRANAVRSLLVSIYDINSARLEAFGRGKSELKDKDHPEDGINRRVEIRNVTK